MAKYKKREIHIIDMSGRLNVKIIHAETTAEDIEQAMKEYEESRLRIEKQMQDYEQHIKRMFIDATSEAHIHVTCNDADYFIKKYGEKFSGRNPKNIENRIKMYEKYIDGEGQEG
nr:MAG TPA: Transcription factor Dp-1, Transcription factor sandwich, CELL CYCLE, TRANSCRIPTION.55A [Caudoviricetes sp.]